MQKYKIIKLCVLVFLIFGVTVVFFATGAHQLFRVSVLRSHLGILQAYFNASPWLFGFLFLLVYAFVVSTPTGLPAVLNVVAGMLYPLYLAVLLVCLGELIGGWVLFYVANTALGAWLAQRSGSRLRAVLVRMNNNAMSIVFLLRLLFVFPCWFINLVSGLTGLTFKQYSGVTFLGAIPAAIMLSLVGQGLVKVVDEQGGASFSVWTQVEFWLPALFFVLCFIGFHLFKYVTRSK